jgi:hypothetical protein
LLFLLPPPPLLRLIFLGSALPLYTAILSVSQCGLEKSQRILIWYQEAVHVYALPSTALQ